MLRIHAQPAARIEEAAQIGFVAPTSIAEWMDYLNAIRSTAILDGRMPERLRRNIGHKLQSLEFETAMILHYLEVHGVRGVTLHETVLRMKIHQCCVAIHMILEGIGSHLARLDDQARTGNAGDPNRKIGAPRWRKALVEHVTIGQNALALSKSDIRECLENITEWRDKIHLDRFFPDDELHFNQFNLSGCYIPTYRTFRMILSALNSAWPDDCCLNEDLQDPPRVAIPNAQ